MFKFVSLSQSVWEGPGILGNAILRYDTKFDSTVLKKLLLF